MSSKRKRGKRMIQENRVRNMHYVMFWLFGISFISSLFLLEREFQISLGLMTALSFMTYIHVKTIRLGNQIKEMLEQARMSTDREKVKVELVKISTFSIVGEGVVWKVFVKDSQGNLDMLIMDVGNVNELRKLISKEGHWFELTLTLHRIEQVRYL